MHLIVRWIASAVALVVTVFVGHALGLGLGFNAAGAGIAVTAFEAAFVIGLVNAVVRPIVALVAMPITCLTLGVFSLVINAAMFWLTSVVVHGFIVHGFLAALFGSVVMSLVSGPLNWLLDSAVKGNHRD
jgi:putative membrane protein